MSYLNLVIIPQPHLFINELIGIGYKLISQNIIHKHNLKTKVKEKTTTIYELELVNPQSSLLQGLTAPDNLKYNLSPRQIDEGVKWTFIGMYTERFKY